MDYGFFHDSPDHSNFQDPPMNNMGPLDRPALFNELPHELGHLNALSEHHFLTRPQAFVSGSSGLIHLPHAIQPSESQLHDLPFHSEVRPPMHQSDVRIYAQNIIIEPKVNHISFQSPSDLLDTNELHIRPDQSKILLGVNKMIHKLFPYLKHRFETIHAGMNGASYNVNNGQFLAEVTPSTVAMVTTDIETNRAQAIVSSNGSKDEFSPLLSSVEFGTSGGSDADVITSFADNTRE